MNVFQNVRKRSAGYAKDRMKLLLVSERIDCSPQMMKMLRSDLIHTVRKYVRIEEEQVQLKMAQEPPVLYVKIPVQMKRNRLENDQTI